MSSLTSPQRPNTDVKKVAILFSGGPAPAANAVIGGAALCFARAGVEVYGMLNGYTHLVEYNDGDVLKEGEAYVRLDKCVRDGLRTKQGICIGTARANPGKALKTPEDLDNPEKTAPMETVYKALCSLGVDALVSIGGDDTLTTAAKFKLYMDRKPADAKRIKVVHLPKTIDNDYEGIPFTFGYFSAVEMLAKELRNLLADSEAAGAGFVCQLMGRAAAWLAYGAAVAGEASAVVGLEDIDESWKTTEVTIDPETGKEVLDADGKPVMRTIVDMSHVVNHLVDVYIAREKEGQKGFVAVISEIEKCVSHDEYLSLKPDTFGHFPVSQLKYSSRLGRLMAEEYKRRTGKSKKFNGLQFGYEVRCNQPTAYDVCVGSQIGVGCYRALCEQNLNGVMISVNSSSDPMGLSFPKFEELINMSKLRAYPRPIKVGSDMHKLARYLEAWR